MNRKLESSRGDRPADLLIKGGRVANVLSLEYEDADVAITDGVIVGVGSGYEGESIVDARGKILTPGMIDGHLHIESTMMTPSTFAYAVVPRGTTTVMPDPHEIANTCGLAGIEFMHRESVDVPLDMFFAAPSCVPASDFETPREPLGSGAIGECYDRGWCTHLGEMMNFPGLIAGDEGIWAKLAASRDVVRTAHTPGLTGRDLCVYLLSGCDGDHEANSADEALEKLRRGIWVMMREGATEHNLADLAEVILADESRFFRCMAVSDDLTANYILENGHMDHKVRIMIERGIRPLVALAMVTINPAQYFRLWDRGAIAPGKIADIAMVDSLGEFSVEKVWKRGKLVAADGQALFEPRIISSALPGEAIAGRIKISRDAFAVRADGAKEARVIEVLPGSVLSRHLIMKPKAENGFAVADPSRDMAKMVVVEKNRATGRTAIGFVKGFGMSRGSIASSVAHDAHNFVAIGMDDDSIATALGYLVENGGGIVAADGDRVTGSFALPVGGLMSLERPDVVASSIDALEAAARELGVSLSHPYMAMSFLSLSVIPELKLTDQGYVDFTRGGKQTLFVQ